MEWSPFLNDLNYYLANLIDDLPEAKRIAKAAGLNTGLIEFRDKAITNWFNILHYAAKRNELIPLLEIITSAQEIGYKDQYLIGVLENLRHNKTYFRGPDIADKVAWEAPDAAEKPGSLERIMESRSTLLPISFLELGLRCAQAVARIELMVEKEAVAGTGFMIGGNWLITNNHVLATAEEAARAIVQFNYQKNINGLDMAFEEFKLDPAERQFFTNVEEDWTIVKIKGDANAKYGALSFSESGVQKKDFVNIVQHPAGGPKQIALYHNVVMYSDENKVQYLTDTLPGSSGSPVFDSDWKVVALHHSGGWIQEPGTKMAVYRNEGINIRLVQKALKDLKIN